MVIRTADHGELGLAHGTYRQKHFNVYKEALNVPMVFSNPGLWPRNQTSDALISHVDFVPTIARLIGTPRAAMAPWQGVDYSGIVAGKSASVQDYVVFTYDDLQTGSYAPNQLLNLLRQPNHIVAGGYLYTSMAGGYLYTCMAGGYLYTCMAGGYLYTSM